MSELTMVLNLNKKDVRVAEKEQGVVWEGAIYDVT